MVTGVHRDDNMTVRPLAQKTSKWKHAEINRGNGKLSCQRSEYAQGSARIKSDFSTVKVIPIFRTIRAE
jgi:hypothetical protein